MQEEKYWSKKPQDVPEDLHHADQGLTACPSAGALQQTHTHTHIGVMHQTQTKRKTSFPHNQAPPTMLAVWRTRRPVWGILITQTNDVHSAAREQMSNTRTTVWLCVKDESVDITWRNVTYSNTQAWSENFFCFLTLICQLTCNTQREKKTCNTLQMQTVKLLFVCFKFRRFVSDQVTYIISITVIYCELFWRTDVRQGWWQCVYVFVAFRVLVCHQPGSSAVKYFCSYRSELISCEFLQLNCTSFFVCLFFCSPRCL